MVKPLSSKARLEKTGYSKRVFSRLEILYPADHDLEDIDDDDDAIMDPWDDMYSKSGRDINSQLVRCTMLYFNSKNTDLTNQSNVTKFQIYAIVVIDHCKKD